jgi:hypothetical protein
VIVLPPPDKADDRHSCNSAASVLAIPCGRRAADSACLIAVVTERDALADNHRLLLDRPAQGTGVGTDALHKGLNDAQDGAPTIEGLPAEDGTRVRVRRGAASCANRAAGRAG